jgi:hypothetical protein
VQLEGLSQLKVNSLIGTRTRELPACSIAPQPSTLSRAQVNFNFSSVAIAMNIYNCSYNTDLNIHDLTGLVLP